MSGVSAKNLQFRRTARSAKVPQEASQCELPKAKCADAHGASPVYSSLDLSPLHPLFKGVDLKGLCWQSRLQDYRDSLRCLLVSQGLASTHPKAHVTFSEKAITSHHGVIEMSGISKICALIVTSHDDITTCRHMRGLIVDIVERSRVGRSRRHCITA